MAKLKKSDVEHVAKLANLTLSQKELTQYTKQLEAVLDYMDVLNELDTSAVEPTYQILDDTKNIFREDKVQSSLTQDDALSSAKDTYNGFFVAADVFGSKKEKNIPEKATSRIKLDQYNAILTKANPEGNLGHKDLFVTKGIETTAGSRVLAGYLPQYDGTVVKLLKDAGYVTKYKLNQDAWGHGASGENSDFGPTKNPWDMSKVSGGSSSGSAVAVATGVVELATATDTCGSVRMPASYTNVCGIKPTYGAVSRYGVIAFASSLDCPSLISSTVTKLRKYFQIIYKGDPLDATSQSKARSEHVDKKVKKLGIPREFISEGIDKETREIFLKATEIYKSLGYEIVDISLPHTKYGVAAYYIIAPTETASNLSRYDGVRYGHPRSFFGPEAKRRIMLGTFASSAGYVGRYYEKAARARTLIKSDLAKAFEKVDAIVAPVSPIPPYDIGEKVNDPLQLYLMDVYAAPASLSGVPSLALPCGFTNSGLPTGMQIFGPRWSEGALFDLGEKYQAKTDWHKKKPKV
ncbi:hypothetical protein A3F62_03465 [Candidatus Woesebacteria bacterium RIFCSPHIGHO2_12_FULL_44_11]|uniref:Multifunctional fusion protein n=1 Tax=Candidatus Woesebacteria bacterium RIFCSPLOWO2_01_FULL_44_14 TaxID=1802525 RepID=A0A1F8BZD2_9BACT|nr:MAG: hypothetical protein A3F62_03465 [Candidatus Woesebacteria bacterium RIFCSPHIGHO2_12_FULL_44_11]OGM68715.1 MAG: hypothetical protein A2975_05445 [Candidatus Woesebacteria bacterium RIFCSPLOWO2_01_FULL_44_14]